MSLLSRVLGWVEALREPLDDLGEFPDSCPEFPGDLWCPNTQWDPEKNPLPAKPGREERGG